jgi:SAM-dependent methyltransferase
MSSAVGTDRSIDSSDQSATGLGSRLSSRLRPRPAARYVHPKAAGLTAVEGDHDANLDVAEERSGNYLQWIADSMQPFLGHRVLEVGAGNGSITERYAPGRSVLATDLSDWCIEELQRRFDGNPDVMVRQVDLRVFVAERQRFDSVVMLNVLEHILDDVAALRTLKSLLEPEGTILLYVPALNGLYGPWDRKVGHFRRYAAWRMREVLHEADLEVVEMRYMNVLSLPAWWAFSRTDVDKTAGGSLAFWDRTGVPLSRRLESLVRSPIGLNLFCVAR